MKISKKDARLLLYTGGILTILLVFLWVYRPAQEQNEALRAENAELEVELAARQEHAVLKDEYQQKTVTMQAEIDETLSIFPAAVKEEDIILYANELEEKSDMEIANIGIGAVNQIGQMGETKFLNDTQVGYTFTVSYDDMKKMVEAIQSHDDKRNVESVVLSFDSATAKIIGTMNVNFYSMTGTEKEYKEPQVPGIAHGTKNIFGTVSSGSDSQNAGADGDADAADE